MIVMSETPAFRYRQWSRGFALLFFVGALCMMGAGDGDKTPFRVMMGVGMIGWFVVKIRLWFYTDHFR
jgi:hypothetical protein